MYENRFWLRPRRSGPEKCADGTPEGAGLECWIMASMIPTPATITPRKGLAVAGGHHAGRREGRAGVRHRRGASLWPPTRCPGIRAAVCSEPYTAEMTVRHNNANIIAMGARVVGDELAKKLWMPSLTPSLRGPPRRPGGYDLRH